MKLVINKQTLKDLRPCSDRYVNYLRHYADFEGSVYAFLDLPKVSHEDKLWVSLRILPQDSVVAFAIDCAIEAAVACAAANAERQRQINALKVLFQAMENENKDE